MLSGNFSGNGTSDQDWSKILWVSLSGRRQFFKIVHLCLLTFWMNGFFCSIWSEPRQVWHYIGPSDVSSRHSNLNFAHHFVIYWLFQNGANKNQHQDSYQRDTIPDTFVLCFKIGMAKKVNRVSKIHVCMWVRYNVCAEGIFVTFPWWLKMWKICQK